MRRVGNKLIRLSLLAPIIIAGILCFAPTAHAEKSLTLSASSSSVRVGDEINVPIYVNTDSVPINVVGFKVNFSTEILEGLVPDRNGSICNTWAHEFATKIDCGNYSQPYSGDNGLVTTLRFKGRSEGQTTISIEPGSSLHGVYYFAGFSDSSSNVGFEYSANSIIITVAGQGEVVSTGNSTGSSTAQKVTLIPPTLSEIIAPSNTAPVTQSDTQTVDSSTTFGSKAQVSGNKGSQPEEPLQSVAQVASSIKGIFSGASFLWTSILPTAILLLIIALLGVKLYINEKRRQAHLERILHKQLGTLSALESKIEIIDQKSGDGREQYLQEIESAKADISSQAEAGKAAAVSGNVRPTAQ